MIMAACVARQGTDAQKRHYLPRFATGELRGGLALTAAGLALGLGASVLLPRLLAPVLATYIASTSPASLIDTRQQAETTLLAVLLLLVAALAACALPSGRAAATEPALALRAE